MMEWLHKEFWKGGEFQWWVVVGFIGNAVFFSRVFVQWYAAEKKKRVVVPTSFWWLSIVGSLILFGYALFYKHDVVFIFAYAFTWIPYVRNLVLHRRHADAHVECGSCGADCPPGAKFCAMCGAPVATDAVRPAA